MPLADVLAKTTITGFSNAHKTIIENVIKTAYNGSAVAKKMFDDWIAAGKTIDIKKVPGVFQAFLNTGRVEIDLDWLNNYSYINPTGKAVLDVALGAIVHELGHALHGTRDNVTSTDYMGDNVKFSNKMFKQLGLDEQISYIAYSNTLHKLNYQYTNGQAIDSAKTEDADFSTALLGNSKDLLIGGPSGNKLQGGDGADFLVGAGGNDELNGGAGTDTAVYFGKPTDYDVRRNDDGSWTVKHDRGAKNEGNDKLINVEKIQFDGGKTFDLRAKGLTFQTDFAFVIDATGSMGSSIGAVRAQATSILNALFGSGKIDARIGVVTFRDETIGEATVVNQTFTDQRKFGDRKAAAQAAINNISVFGGGDLPETPFAGLVKALDGSMGDWRVGAGVHRIALFTDAAAKDGHLAGMVASLAAKIGGAAARTSSATYASGSVDTFTFTFGGDTTGRSPDSDGADNPVPNAPLSNEPLKPDTTTSRLEVYTIFTGDPAFVDTSDLDKIVADTRGEAFSGDSTEVVDALLDIIKTPVGKLLVGKDGAKDRLKGGAGPDDIQGLGRNDVLNGRKGNDILQGGEGKDTLIGGAGADDLRGGADSDTASYVAAKARVVADLGKPNKNKGEAKGDSYASVENLKGSKFGDTLTGDKNKNKLEGGKGNDKLTGLKDADKLKGGDGGDSFIFKSIKDSTVGQKGRDTVLDFARGQGDKVNLKAIDAKTGKKNDAFDFIAKAAFSGDKGELRFETAGKKTIVYGDVNGDGNADFSIAFNKAITFQAGDFVL